MLAPSPKPAHKFDPDPQMEASIEAKIELAVSRGVNLTFLDPTSPASADALAAIGFTDVERRYMAGQHIFQMVQIIIGQKVVETLNANDMHVARADLIPCITAYFEAVDRGEIPTAA